MYLENNDIINNRTQQHLIQQQKEDKLQITQNRAMRVNIVM